MSRGSAIAPDVGIMTHFAHASEPSSNAHKSQLRRIDEILSVFSDETVSLNNSAGCLLSESTSQKLSCSLGRPGIALYGGNPFANRTVDLRSVVRLLAPVRQTRTIRAGESVGYDGVYTATKTTDIATIGIGYADGIPRNISGKAHVNVNGEKAPIIGRVSMDTIIIDLSKIPKRKREAIKVGTPAELIGKTNITDFASWCHTIPYEILTGLGARLHRLYVDQ
jgi:alanine racemase